MRHTLLLWMSVGCKRPIPTTRVDPNGPVEIVLPEQGAYTGAFIDFGDEEDDVDLETVEEFEAMVGNIRPLSLRPVTGENKFSRPTI